MRWGVYSGGRSRAGGGGKAKRRETVVVAVTKRPWVVYYSSFTSRFTTPSPQLPSHGSPPPPNDHIHLLFLPITYQSPPSAIARAWIPQSTSPLVSASNNFS